MFRRTLLGLGLAIKLAGCGGDQSSAITPHETGPDDFEYCAVQVARELRDELGSRRDNVNAYCQLFALDYTERIESCLDQFGPYIHVCENIDPKMTMTPITICSSTIKDRILSYEENVATCVDNLRVGRYEYEGITALCISCHIEDE